MTDRTDNELLIGSRIDPAQFAELYQRHVDCIIGFVARRTDNAFTVADLVSSTFLTAMESRSNFDARKGDALPWLYGIARRLIANQRRREGRAQAAGDRLHGRRLVEASDIERLEERIDAERASPRVHQALAGLKPQHREALTLVGPDKLSVADAANVLDISPAAFRVRLVRARKALRQAMASVEAEEAGNPASFLKQHSTHFGVVKQ